MTASPPAVWVDTEGDLRRAAERLARARAVAVDTEADSFYHYFHKCCLIQVSDGETVYLIDPLALRTLRPLGRLLRSPRTVKVLHAAEQDVLYLKRDYGFSVSPLFDTMIAAQLLGIPNVGLAKLLWAHLGVRLDKGCQRDDWSRRPLSERQKAYAAEDVRHLIRLRAELEADLRAKGRLEWAGEEFSLVAGRTWEPREFDRDGFWSVKGARDLPPRQAAVLRELYAMRDERAREADLPPFRVVSDQTLLALARRCPRSASELNGIKGFTPLVHRRIGSRVLAAVRKGLSLDEGRLPAPPRRIPGRRKSAAASARLERLRQWRRVKAAELGLDPGVLFPQATMEALASVGPAGLSDPSAVQGLREWRRRLLLPEAGSLLD
ncbi:MAG: ribonuclease D [Acidobacteriota bacterium]